MLFQYKKVALIRQVDFFPRAEDPRRSGMIDLVRSDHLDERLSDLSRVTGSVAVRKNPFTVQINPI